jgi:hypothetical protein
MVVPYDEILVSDNEFIRTFKESLDSEELKWHWDGEDRIIEAMHETDWMFQFDNRLPIKLSGKIEIKKGVWHRLIKGKSDVKIRLKKIS